MSQQYFLYSTSGLKVYLFSVGGSMMLIKSGALGGRKEGLNISNEYINYVGPEVVLITLSCMLPLSPSIRKKDAGREKGGNFQVSMLSSEAGHGCKANGRQAKGRRCLSPGSQSVEDVLPTSMQHSPNWRLGKLTRRDEELRLVATILLWLVRTAFVFIQQPARWYSHDCLLQLPVARVAIQVLRNCS